MDEPRPRDFDRWVILNLRLRHGGLWLEYRDETGERRDAPADAVGPHAIEWQSHSQDPPPVTPGLAPSDLAAMFELLWRFPTVMAPADVEPLLKAGFEDFTDANRSHWAPEPEPHGVSVPWLLPVFFSPPPGLEAAPWEPLLRQLLRRVDPADRCVLVQLARAAWKPARALTLPLTIRDSSHPAADWLASIRRRRWYADNAAVREAGIRLEPDPNLSRPRAQWRASSAGAQILLARAPIVPDRRAPGEDRLRLRDDHSLIVAFNGGPLDEGLSGSLAALWNGASLLLQQAHPVLPDTEIEATVTELVYALVHDFALHEVLWILRQARPEHTFLLVSDPAANQALRLSRIMRQVVDDTLALTVPWAGADPSSAAFEQARVDVCGLAFDFSRESRGLTDMCQLLTGSIRKAQLVSGAAIASHLTLDAKTREELGRTQTRRADVALDEYNEFGVLTPLNRWARRMPLRPGWRYRLRVHIGHQDRMFSAVEGDVPAIDPLLPHLLPEQSHQIDVAVFEKTFGLLSRGVQTLTLPPFGGSAPVYFELRSPTRPGTADLRVALYYANNLLQSFVLEAEIAESLRSRPERQTAQVRVRLTSSGTTRFGNLGDVGDRAISLALNDDAASGSHTVMVKRGGLRESIALTESQVEEHMGQFRTLLGHALGEGGASQPLFLVNAPASPQRDQQFQTYLREFARIGNKIWRTLIVRSKEPKLLLELQQAAGETVQFVRHGKLLPFPWQTVYDYPLPEGAAFARARVCFADTPVVRPLRRREVGCPHHPGEDVVCVEGFWSVRHCFEQISEDRDDPAAPAAPAGPPRVPATPDENRVTRIDVPPGNPLVCLGIGNEDQPARRLKQQLVDTLPSGDLRVLTADDDPIEEILWDAASRPGLLVVLSHLEPADDRRNLPVRLQAVVPVPPALPSSIVSETILLDQKLHLDVWQAPRPFVLLMACESSRVLLKDLTNLVDAFFGVGAAAVAGTESEVLSDLAADFAKEITIGLTTGRKPLGPLLRSYMRQMLERRNPLPFAFTVFGSADLSVGRSRP